MTTYSTTYRRSVWLLSHALALCLAASAAAFAQSSSFTYQGKLTDSASPANGLFDMQFKLFDTATVGTGTQQGAAITNSAVQVTNGAFSIQLDFGAVVFDGAARFVEINIRPTGSPAAYTVLSPRQAVTAIPYAIRSLNATQLDGQPASGFIQNTTTQQAGTSFNIGGSGTVGGTLTGGVVNASTQYNINGMRMIAISGPFDDGFGVNLAASNTFLGEGAGLNTVPAPMLSSLSGKLNTFFGASAGKANSTGNRNSFFGTRSGQVNTTGCCNSFFGDAAGAFNTTGSNNSFFGNAAGSNNSTGSSNSFIGLGAGLINTTGNTNSFFGIDAGHSNTTGSDNTLIGSFTDLALNNLTNATAIGARARVDQSNSLVLGGITGVNGGTSVKVGIGTTAPKAKLHVAGGDVFIAQPNSVIITSPNGACFQLRVSDAGVLSAASVSCPN